MIRLDSVASALGMFAVAEASDLHDDLQSVICENSRRELGATVGLTLVARVSGKQSDARRMTVGRLEGVWDEVCFVRMVECSDGKLELVRDLPSPLVNQMQSTVTKKLRTLTRSSRSTVS